MTLELNALALELPRARHPNRLAFRGVLAPVDAPSDRPPEGARGHRVVLSREAAERALPSLLGMALDYLPALDGHDARRKVGIITEAEIVGRWPLPVGQSAAANDQRPTGNGQPAALVISGYLYARDFPELIREMRGNAGALGLSYEITEAQVADRRAPIWVLAEVTFTGAAILRREKAAYAGTSIELLAHESSELSSQASAESLRRESGDPCPLRVAG